MAAAVLRLNSPEAEPSSTYSHHHHLPHTPATLSLISVSRRSPSGRASPELAAAPSRPPPSAVDSLLFRRRSCSRWSSAPPRARRCLHSGRGGRSWPGRRWPRCCLAPPLLCVCVGEENEKARQERVAARAPRFSASAVDPTPLRQGLFVEIFLQIGP
ncbi:uncharacterized protein LOC119271588 [Triticum dicoccoides]|uniref:uncharacterized protein LOC119271588 n=1 Tax=Triticum dicoccoides TaxID=85692 RepID=UPI00188E660A|nr:uncharacterized protein LOC119271588 [Triticum dicoccoides]